MGFRRIALENARVKERENKENLGWKAPSLSPFFYSFSYSRLIGEQAGLVMPPDAISIQLMSNHKPPNIPLGHIRFFDHVTHNVK